MQSPRGVKAVGQFRVDEKRNKFNYRAKAECHPVEETRVILKGHFPNGTSLHHAGYHNMPQTTNSGFPVLPTSDPAM